jgi:hypothetical protein
VELRQLLPRCLVSAAGETARPTAQEDYATNPYWLEFFGKVSAVAATVLLCSGGALLWLRGRLR